MFPLVMCGKISYGILMNDPVQKPEENNDSGTSNFNGGTSAITAIGAKTKLLVAYAAAALGVKVSGLDQSQDKGNSRGK